MERNGLRLILMLVSLLLFMACNAENQEVVVDTEPTEEIESASTVEPSPTLESESSLPTARPPTITPTKGPPTPTATLVLSTPTLASSPTLTPQSTSTVQTYTVQPGDTLFALAIQFGVSTEALAQANGINEDDFLQLGQELIIPLDTEDEVENPIPEEATEESTVETPASEEATEEPPVTTPVSEEVTEESIVATPTPEEAQPTNGTVAQNESVPAYSGPPLPDISHTAGINPLTGLPVDDPAQLQRRPLLVRIGNDRVARQSQAGLTQADVVYEEIAEWWVTRFTAIYLTHTPTTIAPIRSARLINVQLAPQYQGALAHSGGSDPVRWEISQAPITNLDEFYHPSPYYYRSNEGWQTRLAIDAQATRNYLVAKNMEAAVKIQGFQFKETIEQGESGKKIFVPYPKATSFTEWRYDDSSGEYLRWINGSPLYDANSGAQISVENVIIYFAPHQKTDIVEDSNGATAIRILINGQGTAWFFRDGKLNKGFWQTDGTRTPYFTHEDGTPYYLKPGQTWIEVVPTYFTIGVNSADEARSSP